MTFKTKEFFVALAAIFTFSAVGFAQEETKTIQETTSPSPQMERGRSTERFGKMGKIRGGHHEGRMISMLSELNLTDSQKQQVSAIAETNKTAFAAQREELKQLMIQRRTGTVLTPEQDTRATELKSQLRAAGKKMNDDLAIILTPEQQTELKQKQTEMRQRHQERRQMKQQNENAVPQNK